MLFPPMRPEFRREFDVPARTIVGAVEAALAAAPPDVVGSVAGNTIEIYPARASRRFWSPRLSVVVYPRERTVVVGKYGPAPDMWTFFVALYALCFFAVSGGSMLAAAQHLTRQPASGLWGVPLGLSCAALVYSAALIGRSAAREQVQRLASFFEACVAAAADASPVASVGASGAAGAPSVADPS